MVLLHLRRRAPTTPAEQTNAETARGFQNENFTADDEVAVVHVPDHGQLAPNHNVFVKYSTNPTDGFINDYWGNSAELLALTAQNQGGSNIAGNYNGVFGTKWTASSMVERATSIIDVVPFKTAGALEGGAPYWDLHRRPLLQRRHVRRHRRPPAQAGVWRDGVFHQVGATTTR